MPRQNNQYNRYVGGSAAYDYDYLERERRRRSERERVERARRERQEMVRRTREKAVRRKKPAVAWKPRERQHISPLSVLGFAVAAALVVVLVMSYAQLTAISDRVVMMKGELTALQDEHIALLGRYESAFDLMTIKEAAEAGGMAKPSVSQVYYVDLSSPDNVVIHRPGEGNVLGRVGTAILHNVSSLVEYFR